MVQPRILARLPRTAGVLASAHRAAPSLCAMARPMPPARLPAAARAGFGTSLVALKKKAKGGGGGGSAPAEPEGSGELDLDAMAKQMQQGVQKYKDTVQGHISSLGRVDASLLDAVRVTAGKGTKPASIHEYASVGVRDNMLVVTAYDPDSIKHVERAIHSAQLGFAPQPAPEEGEGVVLVPIPRPTGETRKKLAQTCAQAAEQAKIALRNVRQTAQKQLKHDLDAKVVSRNDAQKEGKRLEEITKQHTALVDKAAAEAQKQLQQ